MQENKRKSVTITDIAKECNTSTATVSRILSNSNYPVSNDLKNRVTSKAKELGYIQNPVKQTKTENNQSIAVIVPSLQNQYFVQLVNGISRQALSMGFVPHIFCSQRKPDCERQIINHLLENNINGLLIESIDSNPKCIKNYIDKGGHVCLFDSNLNKNIKGCLYSINDYSQTASIAADYLVSNGHTKIALISAPLSKTSRIKTAECFVKALKEYKVPFDVNTDLFVADNEEELEIGLYDFEIGKILAKRILDSKKRFTAVLALNDILAIGAMKFFQSKGFIVPKDISVMGLDDIPLGIISSPPLTTIHISSELQGMSACQILINSLINNQDEYELDISIRPKLVIRNSVYRYSHA